MNTHDLPAGDPGQAQYQRLTWNRASAILGNGVVEALVLAFLVQIFGSVALAIANGVWSRMIPSAPPISQPAPKTKEVRPAPGPGFSLSERHRFALLFAVIFAAQTGTRLVRYSRHPSHRIAAVLAQRWAKKLSEEWFSLVVVNAIVASVMVSVLAITRQFTVTNLVWDFAGGAVRSALEGLGGLVPGSDWTQRWLGWYQVNQTKFMFWLLYSTAICDDLGLPNYKSLGRWLWHRLMPRRGTPSPTTVPKK